MEYTLVDNGVKVTLHDETGEGWNGDYDPSDPNDSLLLRFDVDHLVDGEWEPVDNGSMCTGLSADISPEKANVALQIIMKEVGDPVRAGNSIKKTCERLSWIEV